MASALKAKAYEHIRSKVLAGRWPAGTYLSMKEVAKQIGMSYTPVREAVVQLESEGIVEAVERVGIRPKQITRQEMEQLFDVRLLVESGAAEFAAQRRSEKDVNEIHEVITASRNLLNKMKQDVSDTVDVGTIHRFMVGSDVEQWNEHNANFHKIVVRASGNPKLTQMIANLHLLSTFLPGRAMLPGRDDLKQMELDLTFHTNIGTAVIEQDPQAASHWAREHIANAKQYHAIVFDWLQRDVPSQDL